MTASTAGLARITVELAPGANPAGDSADFDWQSAGSRRTAADIVITAGRDDEASVVQAGSLTLQMDDRDGHLSPRNALGQWYGQLSRGAPLRVVWPRTTDDFTRSAVSGGWGTNSDGFDWFTVPAATSYMSTDGTRAAYTLPFNVAAINRLLDAGSLDVDIVWSFTCPVMPTGAAHVTAAVMRWTSNTDYIRAHVELLPAGTVNIKVSSTQDGSTVDLIAGTPITTASAGTKIWGRARAEGNRILIKTWTGNRGDEPDVWHGSTTDNRCEGSQVGLLLWRLNSNAGTFTAYVDDFEVINILWSGNVPEWAPRWPDKSGRDAVAPISAAGVLRRLQQAGATVRSPLRAQLSPLTYASGYLPLEDGPDATDPASGIPWGLKGRSADVTFAGNDTLPGSDPCIVLNSEISANVKLTASGGGTSGWSAMCLFRCPSTPPSERTLMEINTSGTAVRWQVYADGAAYGFRAYDQSDTLIANNSGLFAGVVPTEWVAIQIETAVSAGTVSVALLWHQVGASGTFVVTDTYAGTPGRINNIVVRALTNQMALAHLWIGDEDLPFVNPGFRAVANGWAGEQAGARIARLAEESGTPVLVLSGDTEQMGPQRSGAVMDLFRECEAADLGTLFERGNVLAYRPRARRYSPPVAMALDWSLGHLAAPPQPQDDDQRLANYVTVARTSGSSAVAQDQDSIDREGVFDNSRTINIYDDERLQEFADWLLHLGTADNLRWPRINIDLVAHPELIPAWLGCTIGSRITIANPPAQISGEVIDLIIEGYSQTINVDRWDVELSCSPAQPWAIGQYDSSTSLWQLRSTTTVTAYGAGATTINVTTTENEPMSASSAYVITISGEDINVPIGGAGARSGSGPWTQTLSGVTRAVNGVSKSLPSGSPVKIKHSGRWAL